MTLFRPEAVEARRQVWLGGLSLVRPVSLAVLTTLVLVTLAAVIAYLAWGEYTRKARVSGVLMPDRGVIRLVPPQAAVVESRLAQEGQAVKKGDALFVLALDRVTSLGDAQATVQQSLAERERSLREASRQQAALAREQAAALERKLSAAQREGAQLAAEARLHEQRLALAEQTLSRWESLRDQQFVSSAQVQAKTEEMLAARAQLQGVQRQRATQQREIAAIEAQQRELPLAAQQRQGEIERDIAELAQKSAESAETVARRTVTIRAPSDGVLSAVLAEPGQSVSPASALASLLPADAKLQAHLYAPSSAVGFVRTNQPVLLRYEAFPYQKFGHQRGRVMEVSRTPLQPAELAAVAPQMAGSAQPMYRITVALAQQSVDAYGEPQQLVAGMQLDADVQLERRRLVEWIFEPLLGLAKRV
jgi:membrane fusion protein